MLDVQKIKELMHEEGLNQSAMARRLGVSKSCISRILRGQRVPSSLFIARLKQAFPDYGLDRLFVSLRENGSASEAKKDT